MLVGKSTPKIIRSCSGIVDIRPKPIKNRVKVGNPKMTSLTKQALKGKPPIIHLSYHLQTNVESKRKATHQRTKRLWEWETICKMMGKAITSLYLSFLMCKQPRDIMKKKQNPLHIHKLSTETHLVNDPI